MCHDREHPVGIALDGEVQAIIVIHTCLPDILSLIILLGAQRGVAEVAHKKAKLFIKLGFVLG